MFRLPVGRIVVVLMRLITITDVEREKGRKRHESKSQKSVRKNLIKVKWTKCRKHYKTPVDSQVSDNNFVIKRREEKVQYDKSIRIKFSFLLLLKVCTLIIVLSLPNCLPYCEGITSGSRSSSTKSSDDFVFMSVCCQRGFSRFPLCK